MSFPTVVSRTKQRIGDGTSYGGTTHNVSVPTHEIGDLVIMFMASRQDTTSSPSGWTVLANSAYNWNIVIARVMDGTEGATIPFTFGTTGNSSTIKYVVRDYTGFPEVAASVSGDPPSLSPSWGAADTLWIAAANRVGGSNVITTGAPVDYSNFLVEYSPSTLTTNNVASTADRELNAATEDPGSFAGALQNKSVTIAIQGIVAAGPDTYVLTKSLRYVVVVQTAVIKSLKYLVISIAATVKSLTYRVLYTPPAVTKSLTYVVSVPTAIQKSLTYCILRPNYTKNGQYSRTSGYTKNGQYSRL